MDDIKARFEEKVQPVTESGCWIWMAGDFSNGYGCFTVGGVSVKAHRASYLIYKGALPKNLMVCHKCDTPSCVNPDHLFLGTAADNLRDAMEKGRFPASFHRAAIDSSTVAAIRRDSQLMTNRNLCRKYDMSKGSVYRVVHRVRPYDYEVN
ncbi:HNH endonuclease signature motif containing protein [Stenotrophomonas maltophilia]|uniref:HNH endonuclease signature motif containing protein n=1 Tax=Stenotrophomonas maltophilia TaxID=40324 RepID=UPI0015DF284B|nr:HNH endonuclease signature motif containing protein [Stenotrophomonas maltophilia]MBA0362397.1 HNH endonuclease [Stenotrophomonas maltophilia]